MQAVVAALREHERFVVAAHENPDGDALGSLLAMHLALEQLGKESAMFIPGEAPASRRVHLPPARAASGESRRRIMPTASWWRSTARRKSG